MSEMSKLRDLIRKKSQGVSDSSYSLMLKNTKLLPLEDAFKWYFVYKLTHMRHRNFCFNKQTRKGSKSFYDFF